MTNSPAAGSKRSVFASLATLFMLAGLALSACGDDVVDDRCQMTRACFPQDEFGCCGTSTFSLTVCEPCPGGQVEQSECRVSGCEACEDICRPMLEEEGCCGSARRAAGNASAGCECPEGTVADAMCDAVFPACGCGDEFAPMSVPPQADPLPPIAPPDAGSPPSPDGGAAFDVARPRPMCRLDLGGGCCGESTAEVEACGCRTGTIPENECTDGTFIQCFADLGSGCCGAEVASCGLTECPEGSSSGAECGMRAPEPGDAPPMIAECATDLVDACCGDPVEANACGTCPAGSVPVDTCDPDDCAI